MTIPPAIDPRLLAAEIGAAVAELNRLAHLACEVGLKVELEVHEEPRPGSPVARLRAAVQVVSPL